MQLPYRSKVYDYTIQQRLISISPGVVYGVDRYCKLREPPDCAE